MKYRIYWFLPAFLSTFLLSCGKDKPLPGTASLTIVDAFAGSVLLRPVFNNDDTVTARDGFFYLKYNDTSAYNQFNSYSGKVPLTIFHYNDTAVGSVPVFNVTLDLPVGSIHTLFLTGTQAKPDTLFTLDNPPYHPVSDSSVGVRFVNLSPGSAPVSVNLQGDPNGSEVMNLPYKGITSFKNYPAGVAVTNYVFEFRDMASGALLGTSPMYNVGDTTGMNNWRFRNYTIIIDGLPGVTSGPYAQVVFKSNNF